MNEMGHLPILSHVNYFPKGDLKLVLNSVVSKEITLILESASKTIYNHYMVTYLIFDINTKAIPKETFLCIILIKMT